MLELKNISFEIEEDGKQKKIVDDVSIAVNEKEFLVITGPNGGGKSTLAKLIMGIEQPTSGQILLNEKDITQMDITARANEGVGFAFQQPVRFKGLTVRDLITLAAGKPLSLSEACEYLAEVGLCARDYIFREMDETLSGGELKRIEIAMLMARGCMLSIFDEPEAGIDLWSFHNLIRVFERMRDARGTSIIIISHQERILEIADEIVVIADGKVTQQGTREEILPGLMGEVDSCRYYTQEVGS
ncbi:MAG: ABC transporter ATP-binding protein [Christensenellaceae bacterium]|jgi:Fe-S cluster assembly ATP-binding protein